MSQRTPMSGCFDYLTCWDRNNGLILPTVMALDVKAASRWRDRFCIRKRRTPKSSRNRDKLQPRISAVIEFPLS